MERSTIFISYSHKDKKWKERLVGHLQGLMRDGSIDAWDDSRISPGEDWRREIQSALERSSAAIMLISKDYLSSDFIANDEVRKILRNQQEKGLILYPVLVHPTAYEHVEWLAKMQIRPGGDKAISDGPKENDIDRALVTIVREVMDLIHANRDRGSPSGPSTKQKLVIGVDVGSSKIAVGLFRPDEFDLKAKHDILVENVRRPVRAAGLINQVQNLIETQMKKYDVARKELKGIGIAAPGQVNLPEGILEFGPGLDIRDVSFKAHIEDSLKVEVRVDNDARCATRCELYFGIGTHYESFACIFIGTGVGSGIVINGSIYYGADFCAGEIGHSTLNTEGPVCNCRRRGCLEVYVNGPAIARRAKEIAEEWNRDGRTTQLQKFGKDLDARQVAEAVDNNDEAAWQATREVARDLGAGIANYVNTLNPGAIVLGGGVMKGFYKHMADEIRKVMGTHCLQQLINTTVCPAKFMDHGATIGASCLFHSKERWNY